MRKLFVLVFTLGCADAPAPLSVRELSWSAETVSVVPRVIRLHDDSSREFVFVRPVSIRANARVAVVADGGDDRLFVIDSAGTVVHGVGTRGRGPGELYGVSRLVLRRSSVLVGEAHNGRISEFSFDGTFVRTYQSPFAAGSLGATADHVFSASRSSDFYAAIARTDSLPLDALRRPVLALSDDDNRWVRLPGHDLIVSDSNRTWVFDQGRGLICEYDSAESAPNCARLPRKLFDRLQRYRAERVANLEKAIGMHVDAAPLAKDFLIAGRYLALLLPLPELPVVLFDPADGSLTPVVTLSATLPEWARSARSLAWDGSAFLLVGDDGFGRFDISTVHSALR